MNHIIMENTPNYDERSMFRMDFYMQPPRGQMQLDDLYQIVTDRFHVLTLVFKVASENINEPSEHCRMLLINQLKKHNLDDYVKLLLEAGFKGNSAECRRLRKHDHLSHFVLKMALAFEPTKQKWFSEQEVRLFRWRLLTLDEDSIMAFKCINNLPYDAIPESEQNDVQGYLDMCNFDTPNGSNMPHFKLQFTHALDLISKRHVFLYKGQAFIPLSKLPVLFVNGFQELLCGSFEYARLAALNVFNDARFRHIFLELPKHVRSTLFQWTTCKNLHGDDINELSMNNFPLCMRSLNDSLRVNHHLLHGARVQYILFLKGIGLPLEETVNLLRSEFMQRITEEEFRKKKYAYYVRHLYGKEGKRMDYEPFSCERILHSDVGPRDIHGCPYKVMSPDTLTKKLVECGLCGTDIEDIVKLSQAGKCQEACAHYFNLTHGCATHPTPTTHPNLYFSQSCEKRKLSSLVRVTQSTQSNPPDGQIR